jgi:hypothetical protein
VSINRSCAGIGSRHAAARERCVADDCRARHPGTRLPVVAAEEWVHTGFPEGVGELRTGLEVPRIPRAVIRLDGKRRATVDGPLDRLAGWIRTISDVNTLSIAETDAP